MAYTSLFMASKNQEVEPLTIKDLRDYFLKKTCSRREILEMEQAIRSATAYENEVPTLFEYLMLFSKLWKMDCQKALETRNERPCLSTYRFLCDVESMVYDLTKSVIVDTSFAKYSQAAVVTALYTLAIELQLRLIYDGKADRRSRDGFPLVQQLQVCSQVWDTFTQRLYGQDCLPHVQQLGYYMLLRQQRIFNQFGPSSRSIKFGQIFKDRCARTYSHSYFDDLKEPTAKKLATKAFGRYQSPNVRKNIFDLLDLGLRGSVDKPTLLTPAHRAEESTDSFGSDPFANIFEDCLGWVALISRQTESI